jgi:NADH-quinone oxidoreductase subunit L
VDEKVVDGLVLGVGRLNRTAGFVHAWFDRVFVDGLVNGVGNLTQAFGSIVRLIQTGRIQQYLSLAVAGSILLAAWLILS